MNKFVRLNFAGLLLATALTPASGLADSLGSGNLFIYRVGDGSAALSTAATAVFLDEYTPFGALVQSIALPGSGAAALTAGGNATTEGILSVSQSGTAQATLVFGGYRKDIGGSTPSADQPTVTGRVIGTVNLGGVVNTTVSISDATGSMRSAASTDGSSLFYAGTSAGVRYVGTPGAGVTSSLIDTRNSRQVRMEGDHLFASNGSTAVAVKVQDYGALPTGTTIGTPIITLATTKAVNGFSLFDLSSAVPGADTLYALDAVDNIVVKWSFDGTTWTATGSIAASGALNITGYADTDGVRLFLTSGSTLYTELDSSGYGAPVTGTLTSLATAGANTAFRGISVIPEPSTFCLALLGAAGLLVPRFRRS
jgi:hypothetical protein